MNTVQYLLNNPFTGLSYNNQIAVKTSKRPTPELNLVNKQMVRGKEILRKFKNDVYQKNDWICGCDVRNALFCFPCLLFGGDPGWSQNGITNLVHIGPLVKKHEQCETHLKNVLSFTFLSSKDTSPTIGSDYKKTIQQHNAGVTKNRQALNLLINSIRFCVALESSLKDPEEKETSSQMPMELLDFSSEQDFTIKEHLRKTPVFKETKILQNELLEIMLQVYHEKVSNELKKTDHVAIIIDETSDISSLAQMVLVFRYVVNGTPVERFWKFLNPMDRNVDSIYQCILRETTSVISVPEKLIAQSYCGTTLNGGSNEVSMKIKNAYPSANFVHCYAHQPNIIIYNAASSKSQCRIFFANLTGLCRFFSVTPKLSQMLDDILKQQNSKSPKIKWEVNSRFVNVVYEYREALIDILQTIETSVETTVHSTIQQSGAYACILKDEKFAFWLTIFQKLFPPMEALFGQLQNRITDTTTIRDDIETFVKAVEKIRSEIAGYVVNEESVVEENVDNEIANLHVKIEITDHVIKEEMDDSIEDESYTIIAESDCTNHEMCARDRPDIEEPRPSKRKKDSQDDDIADAVQVCDLLLADIKNIFKFSGHFASSNLFLIDLFPSFDKNFPGDFLRQTVKCFPFLDQIKLKTELKVIYNNGVLRHVHGAASLLSTLSENGLTNIFEESTKLLNMVLTIPVNTSDSERCFSKLRNIQNFLRNASDSLTEDKLNALGVLCCEKQFLNETDYFNDRVIDILANKSHRKMDFAYC